VPNQGPSRGEYSSSHRDYRDARQGGTTHTSYGVSHGTMCPQALQSSSLRPGTPAGYNMAPHTSQQPPMGPRPPSESVRASSVQSANSRYPGGFVRQQNLGQIMLALPSSQGSAFAWNALAESFSNQSASESHSPYNPGGFRVICLQNPRSIAAAPPPQGPTGVQNAWVPVSQVYLYYPFSRQPLPEDNRTIMVVEKKRKALVVCNRQTEYRTHILIPIGIEDWDQLLPTSRLPLQAATLQCGCL
jgi:hypothetical protein